MKELPFLFLKTNSETGFAQKLEQLDLVINAIEFDELTLIAEKDPYQIILINELPKNWKTWTQKHSGHSLVQLVGKGNEFLKEGFIEWINLDMENQELGFRLQKARENHLKMVELLKNELRFKKEREIQNQVNDRLLSVSLELKQAKEKIEQLSLTDALTKLKNRRYFNDEAQKEIQKADRYNTDLCMMILDIDDFKKINDTFGHQVGDQVLEKLGVLIKDSLRDTDWAARYGGEEFCVILPMTSESGALKVAERLRLQIEQHLGEDFNERFTTSLGLSKFTKGLNLNEWFGEADKALYHSKKTGKNKVTYYSTQTKEYCEYSS